MWLMVEAAAFLDKMFNLRIVILFCLISWFYSWQGHITVATDRERVTYIFRLTFINVPSLYFESVFPKLNKMLALRRLDFKLNAWPRIPIQIQIHTLQVMSDAMSYIWLALYSSICYKRLRIRITSLRSSSLLYLYI